jgi:UDP-3-O-[3-hydroxymyristoyl] glucosamine N-acyltransferase
MTRHTTALKLDELCAVLEERGFPARLEGENRTVHAVSTLSDAREGDLTFLSNPKYLQAVRTTRASAVILKDGPNLPDGTSAIRCEDPYGALSVAIVAIHGHRRHPRWGVSPAAFIDPSARIGENTHVAHGVTLAAEVEIGAECTIYPGCYVGEGTRIGAGSTLYPNVVVYDGCEIGERVVIHAGSVIGEDGLGFAPHESGWLKIPMVGCVIIQDDVEIGANCAIDRGTLAHTEIGSGTKLGNLNVIGHGTRIGRASILVAQVGLAGSVTVGERVTIAGQAGVAGHLSIGDGATVGGQAGVSEDVPEGVTVFGTPAQPLAVERRVGIAARRLPEALARLRALEREVAELRASLEDGEAG